MKKTYFICDIHKFADVISDAIPKRLRTKLLGMEVYTDNILKEHLISVHHILEENDEAPFLTKAEVEIIEGLKRELDKKDCAYFRIINP